MPDLGQFQEKQVSERVKRFAEAPGERIGGICENGGCLDEGSLRIDPGGFKSMESGHGLECFAQELTNVGA